MVEILPIGLSRFTAASNNRFDINIENIFTFVSVNLQYRSVDFVILIAGSFSEMVQPPPKIVWNNIWQATTKNVIDI